MSQKSRKEKFKPSMLQAGRRSQRKGRRRISSALILTRIGWVDWRYADKMESGNERD